ncbi:MAG: MOSC domain-containing protein [Ilumatobacteraceae bacterium]
MRVSSLWRFPVKSMQGEQLERADVDELGITGDRQWALVDLDTGLALTARRQPELLFAAARLRDGDVEITLPDGTATTDDTVLSDWLGRRVELRRAGPDVHGTFEIATDSEDEAGSPWVQWDGPAGTFHDSTRIRVSIMSVESMRDWELRRFRTNVVVDTEGEDGLVGQRVAVGSTVLEVVKQIDRCVMTTRPQPGGIERDPDVLRTINAERASMLGVGAMVATPGAIAVGDELVGTQK